MRDGLGNWHRFTFPRLPYDARERGRTDEFSVAINNVDILWQTLAGSHLALQTTSQDAWLPQTMWVLARSDENLWRLVVAIPNWPTDQWFSTQASDDNGEAKPAWSFDTINPNPSPPLGN